MTDSEPLASFGATAKFEELTRAQIEAATAGISNGIGQTPQPDDR